MKSLMLLWQKVAEESATRCCTSATMDVKTVQVRSEHEGFSFMTITLANFGKDFEKSLDQGYVDPASFCGFHREGGLPRFLGGFLDRVFDRDGGELLDSPCIDAILAVRQLSLMFSKISLPCSDARVKKAMRGYVECEQEVRISDRTISPNQMEDFVRVSDMLFGKVFRKMDIQVLFQEHSPRHGPGATADKLSGNAKYKQRTWPQRLDKAFPIWNNLIPNGSFRDRLSDVDFLEPGAEIPVKVITVPKTLKTPRIIGIEPTSMQYAQQSLLPVILDNLMSDKNLASMLGFDDQEPNQLMAHHGSLYGDLATLDLSEASDRVSNELVRAMMKRYPFLHMGIDSCRSRKACVPGHGVIRLAKFASMGSALCFPIEAMVFLTLVFIGIEKALNSPLERKTIKRLSTQVRIYGDDIIIPVEYVHPVVTSLSTYGAKVNVGKSFWNGKFRESCGKEFYDGHDVSIVKVREEFPSHRGHASGVISLVSLRNQLYFAGYWQTVKWLDGRIRKLITHFPTVLPSSPVLGRHSFLGFETQKLDDSLHSPLVKGYVVDAKPPPDKLDEHGALLKFFLKRGSLPSADRKHLERAGRPQSVNIKLRNASAI